MLNRMFPPTSKNSAQTGNNSSDSLIINYSEQELRELFSSHSRETVLEVVAGMQKFINDNTFTQTTLQNYLNEQPRKTIVMLAKKERDNPDPNLIALMEFERKTGLSGIVNLNPPILAEYEKAETMHSILSNSIVVAQHMITILNIIASEKEVIRCVIV